MWQEVGLSPERMYSAHGPSSSAVNPCALSHAGGSWPPLSFTRAVSSPSVGRRQFLKPFRPCPRMLSKRTSYRSPSKLSDAQRGILRQYSLVRMSTRPSAGNLEGSVAAYL